MVISGPVVYRRLKRAHYGYVPGTRPSEVYSHDGPIRRGKHGYILTMDQSDEGNMGIFSRRANQTERGTPLGA
eukprot:9099841-Pyramimonas_sp.AAC.1